jgi:hypothetical protein
MQRSAGAGEVKEDCGWLQSSIKMFVMGLKKGVDPVALI